MDTGTGMSFWDEIVAFFTAILIWLTGESGRVLVASGLGGVVRWFAMERKRIRTGMLAAVGGAICGYYMWPLVLFLPRVWGWEAIAREPEHIAMAGFLMGTMGVSSVKIVSAIIEARASKLIDGGRDDA